MSSFSTNNEYHFRHQVEKALKKVQAILDTTRSPRFAPDEQDHTYNDKYGLAHFLTNTAVAAQMNVLNRLGADEDKFKKMHWHSFDKKQTVTLRLAAEERCQFLKENIVNVDGKHEHILEVEDVTIGEDATSKKKRTSKKKTLRHKVITKVTEYHWKVCTDYSVYVYAGNDPEGDSKIILQHRSASSEIVTRESSTSPRPSKTIHDPIDVSLAWLLQNISNKDYSCNFSIDRTLQTCRTPRRNDDVDGAISFFNEMNIWCKKSNSYFLGLQDIDCGREDSLDPMTEPKSCIKLQSILTDKLFVPVLPLFENTSTTGIDESTGKVVKVSGSSEKPNNTSIAKFTSGDVADIPPLLRVGDVNLFLQEQCRSLDEYIAQLNNTFPREESGEVISALEASSYMLLCHSTSVIQHFLDGVDCIEGMLRSQLIAAIGKEVNSTDFAEFVRFHSKKLLKAQYAPKPFCHAIRKPHHYPDGVISIEAEEAGNPSGNPDPIMTICRELDETSSCMSIPINAATSVKLSGKRYLHAWVSHQFEGEQENTFKLVARARQFSSFLLMIGKITGPDSFDPQHAVVLQNKDEVLIPLLLNQLPTPKEFQDAIESLSPEQKRFASAFRNMQLESSVFGVCVVQLKPQLEALLGIPSDSLTKEIRLTQDLFSLFIDYQIPSDLLSFDGTSDMPLAEKVAVVKKHVKAVQEMIEELKVKELEQEERKADMRMEMRAPVLCTQNAPYDYSAPDVLSGAPPVAFGAGSANPLGSVMFRRGGETRKIKKKTVMHSSQSLSPFMAESTIETHSSSQVPEASRNLKCDQEIFGKQHHDDSMLDFTQIPKKLDAKLNKLDESSLRATIIKTGDSWTKKTQTNLLSPLITKKLYKNDQKSEKNKAFDLLDALSRSGSLAIACAELHVIIAATHSFDHSLMATVIQDNVNPIEKMERSTLIVASTIHNEPVEELLKDESQRLRVATHSPAIMDGENGN